jgi:hypothetical protein
MQPSTPSVSVGPVASSVVPVTQSRKVNSMVSSLPPQPRVYCVSKTKDKIKSYKREESSASAVSNMAITTTTSSPSLLLGWDSYRTTDARILDKNIRSCEDGEMAKGLGGTCSDSCWGYSSAPQQKIKMAT